LPVRFIEIKSEKRARHEMERIGVSPGGIPIMVPKQLHVSLKVEGLAPGRANVMKQEMLSAGGEVAVSKGTASCSVETTDAIISGTLSQFRILTDKLRIQSFGLKEVAAALEDALARLGRREFVIEGRSKSWTLGARTLVMGILNITPDSFYDGGRFFDAGAAVERALEMRELGAEWIDVGGESTRPGAEPVAAAEEIRRVVPVIEAVSSRGVTVSIDTTKARVAREALDAGAEIVNDVSAFSDPEMAGVCAEHKCPCILMHRRGTPGTMQKETRYADLVSEVYNYLHSRLEYAGASGVDMEKTIVDPGIGFGKSLDGNIELVGRLNEFRTLGRPILIGPSRKSFIGATLGGIGVEERLAGTVAVSTAAIMNGANILRVHDVKESREAADMADAIRGEIFSEKTGHGDSAAF